MGSMQNFREGTIVQIVRVKSELPEEEILRIAREREPQFHALPGLLQKYYVRLDAPWNFGGIYIWDSRESLKAFRASELAASIAKAYQAVEPPSVETVDIVFQLRG